MAKSYLESRYDFLVAARESSALVTSYYLPGRLGPSGEPLAIDVATIGSPNAPNAVVTTSGIHGVELPMGSKLQKNWLYTARETCSANRDIRFVFVHALNPFGAAYGLRNDQDNIDNNRNFISNFDNPPPTSQNYRALKDSFAPPRLGALAMGYAWKGMLKFAFVTHSIPAFKQALASGQYEFPDGLYFGGKQPSWTQQTWEPIVDLHVLRPGLEKLWHVDIHTGYGPRGKLQVLVNDKEGSALHERVKEFALPDEIHMTSTFFTPVTGDIVDAWRLMGIPSGVVVTPVAAEIGTSRAPAAIEGLDVLHSMIERNALKQRYNDRHPRAEKIIQSSKDTFDPPAPEWQNAAMTQGMAFWKRLTASITPK